MGELQIPPALDPLGGPGDLRPSYSRAPGAFSQENSPGGALG
jgi:hypothetical protein